MGLAGEIRGEADGEWEKHIAASYGKDGSADQRAGGCAAEGVCGGFTRFGAAGGRGGGTSSRRGVAEGDCRAEDGGGRECGGLRGARGACAEAQRSEWRSGGGGGWIFWAKTNARRAWHVAQGCSGVDGIVDDCGRSGRGAECGRAESSGAVGGGGGGCGCAVEDGRGGFGGGEWGAGKREV